MAQVATDLSWCLSLCALFVVGIEFHFPSFASMLAFHFFKFNAILIIFTAYFWVLVLCFSGISGFPFFRGLWRSLIGEFNSWNIIEGLRTTTTGDPRKHRPSHFCSHEITKTLSVKYKIPENYFV